MDNQGLFVIPPKPIPMELNALLAHQAVLPSAPKVVALLHAELGQPQPDLRKICQLVGNDVALAAGLLQRANASELALPRKLGGVSEALAVLSLAQVRALVDTASLGTTLTSIPGVNLQQFWRYSLDTARVARSLAACVKQNQGMAYTAGLLHAMGELFMHLGMPDAMARLDTEVPPLDLARVKAERHALGFTYAQVSAGMAQQWRFPQALVDALAYQLAPFDGDICDPLAAVLHLAAWRARARAAQLGDRALAVSYPDEVGLTLGLDIDMVLQQTPIDWTQHDGVELLV